MNFTFDYETSEVGNTVALHADCFEWMDRLEENSVHAIVTDPPYSVREFDLDQLEKRESGSGGVWRNPWNFDGSQRSPAPRFTSMSESDLERLSDFFTKWSEFALRILKPGAHVFLACNSMLAPIVYDALAEGGLEFRGQIIRSDYMTLRGGDRPMGGADEFRDTCTMPRACHEPWALLRKPFDTTVRECLEQHGTGALRRNPDGSPFKDVIPCGKTPKTEREISDHETQKPQLLLRQLVRASLPLGQGVVVDTFMGSGSTLAAAESLGYRAIGVERLESHFQDSEDSIRKLSEIDVEWP